jgi:hypothetical protein
MDFGTIAENSPQFYFDSAEITNAGAYLSYLSDQLNGVIVSSGSGFNASLPGNFDDVADMSFVPILTAAGANTLTVVIEPLSVDSASTTPLPYVTLTVIDDVVPDSQITGSGGPVSIISTAVTQGVAVGAGNYATMLTITPTGSIIYAQSSSSLVTGSAALWSPAYAGLTSVLNAGTIIGQSAGDIGGYGISIQGAGTITNSGYVAGGLGSLQGGAGIKLGANLGAALTNTGRIYGAAGERNGGTGVYVGADAVAYNSGTIIGGNASGTGTQSGYAGIGVYIVDGSFFNKGFVTGGSGQYAYAGVALIGGEAENAGTIHGGFGTGGTLGPSVLLGQGVFPPDTPVAATLVVDPGAVFVGAVLANASAADVLVFGSGSQVVSGIGTQFQNFSEFDFEAGSAATVAGQVGAFDSGQTILGFGLDDELVLDGTQASLALETVGYLTLTNGDTFDFGGLSASAFMATGIDGNTTLSLTQIENVDVPEGVHQTLGASIAANGVTISGGELEVLAGATITDGITFAGTGGTLMIDAAENGKTAIPDDTITGFTAGDTLILSGVPYMEAADSYTVATAGTLSIDADGTFYNLLIAGVTVGQDNFVLSGDLGITETACYVAGTHIATAVGEMKVEDLEICDYVETLDGSLQKIKWIGHRSYDGRFIAGNKDILPIRIAQGAIAENIPSRDLFVSPGHAICIDNALIHAFRLVNGVSITQIPSVESLLYYHIETENHEVIFAENCPAETFLDEIFRAQFQNVQEFRTLYPNHLATHTTCLPLLEDGFVLHAMRLRLNARAGILPPPETHGALRGYVDEPGPAICTGWAQDVENPETPVCLDIMIDGAQVARVLANLYRADLRQAGIGSGCHAFRAVLPAGDTGRLEVHRAADGAELPWTEAALAQVA